LDLIFACQGQKEKQKRVSRVSGTLQKVRTKVYRSNKGKKMGLRGGGAVRDTEGLYVLSDLWIMIISGQKGAETVSAHGNIVSEVTVFSRDISLATLHVRRLKGKNCEIGRSITHKFPSLEHFVEPQIFLSRCAVFNLVPRAWKLGVEVMDLRLVNLFTPFLSSVLPCLGPEKFLLEDALVSTSEQLTWLHFV
jgi:hypothetical protein